MQSSLSANVLWPCRFVLAEANKPGTSSLIDGILDMTDLQVLMQAGSAGGGVSMCHVHLIVSCQSGTQRVLSMLAESLRQAIAFHPT